jgi:hypothetical protein
MNRTQALLIGFVILSWAALVAILVGAPDLYDAELRPLGLAGLPYVRLAFLAAITGLLVLRHDAEAWDAPNEARIAIRPPRPDLVFLQRSTTSRNRARLPQSPTHRGLGWTLFASARGGPNPHRIRGSRTTTAVPDDRRIAYASRSAPISRHLAQSRERSSPSAARAWIGRPPSAR